LFCRFKKGSGYTTGSGLLVLNAIQLVRLFAKLIRDSQSELIPDAALTITLNSYKKEIQYNV